MICELFCISYMEVTLIYCVAEYTLKIGMEPAYLCKFAGTQSTE